MEYTVNFGVLGSAAPTPAAKGTTSFRLAVLGDFSGRANSGELDTGDDLAAHKPLKVDVDNLDDVIGRLGIELKLPIGDEDEGVEISIGSIDDFHPDELYENVEAFEELSGLRQRLDNDSMFASAAEEVQSWLGDEAIEKHARRRPRARSTTIPVGGKLSDFAELMGSPTATAEMETDAEELIKRIVAPHVVAETDPRQDAMIAAVDEAISDLMRKILHHPDFQTLEALWRSVDLLTRRLETGVNLRIVLYDITAEEIAADLSSEDSLEDSGLYKLLVEQPAMDANQGPFSAIVGNYIFEQTPPHAELLGRMAKIAAATQAPFVTAIGIEALKKQDPDDVHPLVRESWGALRDLPEAAYLGLTVPRFLLRQPYGKKSDPIDPFEFEEFTPQYGLKGMLWANSAVLAGLLLGETFSKQGMKSMKLGSVMSVGDIAYFVYNDPDGDQVALPCTERQVSVRVCEDVVAQRFMPVVSIRGTPEVRLASFQSLAGGLLAGPWAKAVTTGGGAPPDAGAASDEDEPSDDESDDESPDMDETGDEDLDAMLAGLGGDDDESGDDDGDDDMEAMLAGLGGDDDESGDDDDTDLDALLAGLDSDSDDDSGDGDDDMDDDLAALLADL